MPLPWSKQHTTNNESTKSRESTLSVPATQEIESLSRFRFTTISILVGIVLLAIGLLLAFLVPHSREPHIVSWKIALLREILVVVGTTIIASILFYWFYSRFLERHVLKEVITEASEITAELYRSRFSRMMPKKVYQASKTPMPDFEAHLEGVLRESQSYKFKGDNAGFTVFRLDRLAQITPLLDKEIKLLVLNPLDEYLLRERAKIEMAGSQPNSHRSDLKDFTAKMKNSIYVTIVAVADLCHKTRIELRFHEEHLFFRSEIFDAGIFLTYYLGGEFPDTAFYDRETLAYNAFQENFRQIWKSSESSQLKFRTSDGDDWLKQQLIKLGCSRDLAELRKDRDQLFEAYSKMGVFNRRVHERPQP